MNYIAGLDVIRAAAVGLVLWGHWMPLGYRPFQGLVGPHGVDLFFVLSGFLMTRILLDCVDFIRSGERPLMVYGRYQARRMGRLDPANFGLVTAMFVTGVIVGTGKPLIDALAFYFYGFNWYVSFLGSEGMHYYIHLWSLAVEYQIYLVLPVLVFAVRKLDHLRMWFIGLAALGLASQLFFAAGGGGVFGFPTEVENRILQSYMVTPACFMPIAFGGLLAVWDRTGELGAIWRRAGVRRAWFVFGLVGLCAGLWCSGHMTTDPLLNRTVLRVGGSIWGAWLVAFAIAESNAPSSRVFSVLSASPAIRYVARVSYGIYLYHLAVSLMLDRFGVATDQWYWALGEFTPYSIFRPESPYYMKVLLMVQFCFNTSATLLLASLSWQIEKRINDRVRARFPYAGRARGGRNAPTQALSPPG